MALMEDGMNTTMLVSPAGGNSGGFGGMEGNSGWWIILLFILLLGGNWGNNWGNSGGNGGGGQPIIVNDGYSGGNSVQRGFDQAAIMGGINGVQSGINGLSTQLCNCCADVQQSLCNGFAGVNATVNSGFANAEIAANGRQMANMNQIFGAQTAMMQGFNNIQSQFADCCCENRLASADLKYTIATENCADRAAISDGIRDILTNQTANTQRILDQLCNDKIDAKNEKIADLERQLTMANLAASQTAQTALIRDGQLAATNALVNELRSCPIPSQPVYGSQPIFTCPNNNGCGCGGGFAN